jgi:hypothetical protein
MGSFTLLNLNCYIILIFILLILFSIVLLQFSIFSVDDSQQGLGIFLFTTASTTALGPTQPPIQWVPGALSMRVKQPGHEADHSPPSSAEVKE